MPVDLTAGLELRSRRGHGDVVLGTGWVFHRAKVLGLAGDLDLWLPLSPGGGSGAGATRLARSLSLSARVADAALVLRTRQGALIDAGSDGARRWASAYAVDVRLAEPIAVGGELDLSVGSGPDTDDTLAGISAAISFGREGYRASSGR